MCVIIHLPPNARMKKEHLVNAVHNNHHSWGLVLVDGNNRTQLIRKCPEPGKYDPEEVWDILEDNLDVHRYLHLRNTTKGATNEANTQPFQVYSSGSRQVYFFHNGTLGSFGTTGGTYLNGQWTYNNPDAISDTRDFCEKILQPALLRYHGTNGIADYNDPYFDQLIMDKQWTASSKGMFVSNDMAPKYYGSGWSQYRGDVFDDNKDAPIIMVSNQDYFKEVTRGPAKPAPEVAGKGFFPADKETTQTGKTSSTHGSLNPTVSAIHDMEITPITNNQFTVSPYIINRLYKFFDGLASEDSVAAGNSIDLSCMAKVSYEEWSNFTSDPQNDPFTVAAMLMFMAENLAEQNTLKRKAEEKLEKATKRCEQLSLELKEVTNGTRKAA